MIIDRLGRELFVGDKVAFKSFIIDDLCYGEVIKLNRTRAVIQPIGVHYTGVQDYREYTKSESVHGYNIMKV